MGCGPDVAGKEKKSSPRTTSVMRREDMLFTDLSPFYNKRGLKC